jgi:hypothetical protein
MLIPIDNYAETLQFNFLVKTIIQETCGRERAL